MSRIWPAPPSLSGRSRSRAEVSLGVGAFLAPSQFLKHLIDTLKNCVFLGEDVVTFRRAVVRVSEDIGDDADVFRVFLRDRTPRRMAKLMRADAAAKECVGDPSDLM